MDLFRILSLSAVVSVSLYSAGCSERPADSPSGRYRIVTTCGMVTDIVRQVAGDRAEVIGLMSEGADPHLYKPTRNDVKQLLEADAVFYNGLLLEGRMTDTLQNITRPGKPVVAVSQALDEAYLREPPEFAGHPDPHIWMDVLAWRQAVGQVADTLAEFDPEGAEGYRARAADYQQQLTELDAYVRQAMQSIPLQQRLLVTAHDAFGYFSRAYDIPVESVQGLSTASEAGVDDINRLVDLLVDRQVKAIFVESSVSAKNIQAVIEGAADRGWQVAIGGELYSDAMGAPETYRGTYIGMIDHNATTIARALGGEAPAAGMRGQLPVEATVE